MQTIIQTPTSNIKDSFLFYKKLNFKKLNTNLVTDGKIIIEINDNNFARAGVKFYQKDWSLVIAELKKGVKITETEEAYLFVMPSGTWIYLMKNKINVDFKSNEESFSVLGNYTGISLETTYITKSNKILGILGFTKKMGEINQGWITLTNKNGFEISLMSPNICPHLFFNPSLTYFNGKNNLSIIKKIKDLKIPIAQEITHFNKEGIVDNIILRDNGGLGFFIFSD